MVEVHELIAKKAAAEETRAWREAFTNALHYFQRKAFDAAEAGFRRTLSCIQAMAPRNSTSNASPNTACIRRQTTGPAKWKSRRNEPGMSQELGLTGSPNPLQEPT